MIRNYLPVLFQILAALALAIGAIGASILLGKKGKSTPAKDTPYECGKAQLTSGRPRFSVKFYLVATIFILFDIEVIFLYPWAVNYAEMIAGNMGLRVLWAMLAFVIIIEIGHLYAYKKGAFDWYTPPTPRR